MSPEHDNNLQPSAVQTVSPESAGEAPIAVPAAAKEQPQDAAGTATAAARAPEAAQVTEAPAESSGTAATAAPDAGSSSEAAPATENPEAEMTETMDRLLDQFSAPEPAAEGEIFDGHVLAVTDAGVVVDVDGKFEGLVTAQEYADSETTIEFGLGQTIEVVRLREDKDAREVVREKPLGSGEGGP